MMVTLSVAFFIPVSILLSCRDFWSGTHLLCLWPGNMYKYVCAGVVCPSAMEDGGMVFYMRLDNCGLNQPVRYADPKLPSRRCVCVRVCVHVCVWCACVQVDCIEISAVLVGTVALFHHHRDASVLFSIYGIMKVPAQQFDLNVQFYISVRLGY